MVGFLANDATNTTITSDDDNHNNNVQHDQTMTSPERTSSPDYLEQEYFSWVPKHRPPLIRGSTLHSL